MKYHIHRLPAFVLVLLAACYFLPGKAAAQAITESPALSISGLLDQEVLRVYPITTTDQWEEPVQEWLEREDAPEEWKDFSQSPEILSRLQPETQDRFAQLLVLAMRNTGNGAELILDPLDLENELTWNTETKIWEGTLDPGGYLLLPASSQRIFSPRLLLVAETQAEQQVVSYEDEEDIKNAYAAAPAFTMTVFTGAEGEPAEPDYLVQGRQLLLRTELNPEAYPDFFPAEKLVRSLSYCFGPGQAPLLDEAQVQDAKLGYALQEGRAYTLESVSNVTVYIDQVNSACFYHDNGLFYFLDGSATGKETAAGAVDAYNLRYGTALKVADLKAMPFSTVAVLTLEEWEDPLVLQFPVAVGNTYIPKAADSETQLENGVALLEGQYHFTTGLLQSDSLGRLAVGRQYGNYSIEAQLLAGGVAGDENHEQEEPLTGGAFTLYRFSAEATFAADATQEEKNAWIQQAIAANPGQGYQVLWLGDQVRLYLFHAAQAVDANGLAGFGGLEPEEYLLVETIYPDGYATLRMGYQITEAAWENAGFQTVIWRNYTGVYLPETGGLGTQSYTITGTAILMMGLFGMLWILQRKKEME